jgi:hypothetical protein
MPTACLKQNSRSDPAIVGLLENRVLPEQGGGSQAAQSEPAGPALLGLLQGKGVGGRHAHAVHRCAGRLQEDRAHTVVLQSRRGGTGDSAVSRLAGERLPGLRHPHLHAVPGTGGAAPEADRRRRRQGGHCGPDPWRPGQGRYLLPGPRLDAWLHRRRAKATDGGVASGGGLYLSQILNQPTQPSRPPAESQRAVVIAELWDRQRHLGEDRRLPSRLRRGPAEQLLYRGPRAEGLVSPPRLFPSSSPRRLRLMAVASGTVQTGIRIRPRLATSPLPARLMAMASRPV